MKKRTKRLIKALVSLGFFGFLFYFVNTHDLARTLKAMDGYYFSLSILLAMVMVTSSCLKWQLSVRLTGEKVPFSRLCGIYLIGYYFSNLLPSNIGGDVVRSYYLGRSVKSQSQAAASVFIERASGMLFLFLLTVLAPLLRPGGYTSPYLAFPALGAAGLLAVFAALVLIPRPIDTLRTVSAFLLRCLHLPAGGWVERFNARLLDAIGGVYEKTANAVRTARHDRTARTALLKMVLLTVWFYLLTWVNVYWAFRTFGAFPTFAQVAAVTPAIMVVSMIPVSLGSLGLAEGAYVLYFSMIGMESSDALAVGLFMRFKVLLVGVVGAWFYLIHKHEVNHDMLQQAETEKDA